MNFLILIYKEILAFNATTSNIKYDVIILIIYPNIGEIFLIMPSIDQLTELKSGGKLIHIQIREFGIE